MPPASRVVSFAWVIVAYVAATFVAGVVHEHVADLPPFFAIAIADLAATLVIFAFSAALDNSSVYDPYWSLAPIWIAWTLMLKHAAAGVSSTRASLVITLIVLWGARLTFNWVRGWQGLEQEDWRYVDFRHSTGRAYWLVSFFGLHLMPTIWVLFGCLPLVAALATGTRPLGFLDLLAVVVTGSAIAVEAVADEQLRDFRRDPAHHGQIMDQGLWSYCRHPNYLGEIGFWWGLFLFGLAADPGVWWTAIGALSITALFVFISIPMIDKRSLQRRPGYAEHMARLPALLPKIS